PWDTAFVHHVGYWAHFNHAVDRSTWPLPRTARAHDLGKFAEENDVLRAEPAIGDVCLMWSLPARAFTRTGIIVGIGARGRLGDGSRCIACTTIEGNTALSARPEGRSVYRVKRAL